ncbi:MAG TPA: MFS transporter [Streptosporangiaceae bacterium]
MPAISRGPFRGLPREVAVLSAISFTVALGYGIVAPAIPEFARQFGVSAAAAASVVSAFALMRVAGALPSGRPVIVTGCAATACGMVMLAALPGLAGYLVALGVSGLGSGLLDVAPAAIVGDIIEGQGGALVASYQMAGDAGSVTGPVAAGYLVGTVSYAAAFELAGGVLGLAAVLGLFAPETRRAPVG